MTDRLLHRLLSLALFARRVADRFTADRCFVGASALSYTTMVSLVPLTAIILATFSGFPIFAPARERFLSMVLENVAPNVGDEALGWLSGFATNAAKTTAYGVGGLVVTSVLLLATVEEHLHFIFRVSVPRRWGQRVLAYWTVLTLGPLLLGVLLTVSGDIDMLVTRLGARPNVAEQAAFAGATWLSHFVPIGIEFAAFTLLYHLIPNRVLRWRDCAAGATLAALLLEAMKLGFRVFVAQMSSYGAIYGALAWVPVALLWMYIFWSVILLGAETSAVLAEQETT